MGFRSYSSADMMTYSSMHIDNKKSVQEIYTSSTIDPLLDPKGVNIRESRDSINHPTSTALIVALDVTGSMGNVLEATARGLKTLAESVYNGQPIPDPQMMFMGIGDVECDHSPLQVTQFETDVTIAEQLTKLYFERGGGGNSYESYALAWYFAGLHTSIDCFEKREKKGYLFTIGDEEPTPRLRARDLERVLGYMPQQDYTVQELLAMAEAKYNVYHIVVAEGSHCRHHGADYVVQRWQDVLGQRVIRLDDHTKIAEAIVSAIEYGEGVDPAEIQAKYDGPTNTTIAAAIRGLMAAR